MMAIKVQAIAKMKKSRQELAPTFLNSTQSVMSMPMGIIAHPSKLAGTKKKRIIPNPYPMSQRINPQRIESFKICLH